MSRLKFRFESIMRIRETARDDARKRVAEAQQAYDVLEGQLKDLDLSRQRLQSQRNQKLTGQLSVASLLDQGRYDLQIEADRQTLQGQMTQIFEEIDRRRQRLAVAEQEYRKFEKLKELAVEEHTESELRRWQGELDEMASQRYKPRQANSPDDSQMFDVH